MCRDKVDPLKGYYHCGISFCLTDFCLSCGKVQTVGKSIPQAQHLEEVMQGPKCSNGHLMKQTKQVIERKNRAGEILWSGGSLKCDMCKGTLLASWGYYHCGNNFCLYDLCLSCGKVQTVGKAIPQAQHLEEVMQGPKCSNGHLMKQTKQVIARKNRAGENTWDGKNPACDICRDSVDPLKGYYHCGNNFCDNDLCLSCGKVGKVLNRNL